MGVVRHAEKTSAGSSALCGSVSSAPHAASKITSDMPAPRGIAPPIVASATPRDRRGTAAAAAADASPTSPSPLSARVLRASSLVGRPDAFVSAAAVSPLASAPTGAVPCAGVWAPLGFANPPLCASCRNASTSTPAPPQSKT